MVDRSREDLVEELENLRAELAVATLQRAQLGNAVTALESEVYRLQGALETARAKNDVLLERLLKRDT